MTGIVVTADGVQDNNDTTLGKLLGINSLIIDPGTVSNEWTVADQIIITTTTDNRSIILSVWRDRYFLELASSPTPTISNLFTPNVETFPLSPEDGQEVILRNIVYKFALKFEDIACFEDEDANTNCREDECGKYNYCNKMGVFPGTVEPISCYCYDAGEGLNACEGRCPLCECTPWEGIGVKPDIKILSSKSPSYIIDKATEFLQKKYKF